MGFCPAEKDRKTFKLYSIALGEHFPFSFVFFTTIFEFIYGRVASKLQAAMGAEYLQPETLRVPTE